MEKTVSLFTNNGYTEENSVNAEISEESEGLECG